VLPAGRRLHSKLPRVTVECLAAHSLYKRETLRRKGFHTKYFSKRRSILLLNPLIDKDIHFCYVETGLARPYHSCDDHRLSGYDER